MVPEEVWELGQVGVLVEESAGGLSTHPLYLPVMVGGQYCGQRHLLTACNLQKLERVELVQLMLRRATHHTLGN